MCSIGIQAQSISRAKLSLKFINNIDTEVSIKQMPNPGSGLKHSNLMALIDSISGMAQFEFDLDKPTDFYWISQVNQLGGQITLKQGDDLVMTIDREQGYSSLIFNGKGALKNNFRYSINHEHINEDGEIFELSQAGKISFSEVIKLKMKLLDRTLKKIDGRTLGNSDKFVSNDFINKFKIDRRYETYQELFLYIRWFKMDLLEEDHAFLESINVNNNEGSRISHQYLDLTSQFFFYKYYRQRKINSIKEPASEQSQITFAKDIFSGLTLESWMAERIIGKIQRGFASEQDISEAKSGITRVELLQDIEEAILLFEQSQISEFDPNTNFIDSNFDSVREILDLFKGKVIYIDFWGSWCGPCISNLPNNFRIQKEFADRDVVFLFLGGRDKKIYWERAIKKNQITGYHFLMTDKMLNEATELFELEGFPSHSLVNMDGEIVDNKPGKRATIELFKKIEKLLVK